VVSQLFQILCEFKYGQWTFRECNRSHHISTVEVCQNVAFVEYNSFVIGCSYHMNLHFKSLLNHVKLVCTSCSFVTSVLECSISAFGQKWNSALSCLYFAVLSHSPKKLVFLDIMHSNIWVTNLFLVLPMERSKLENLKCKYNDIKMILDKKIISSSWSQCRGPVWTTPLIYIYSGLWRLELTSDIALWDTSTHLLHL
jgi:hypothetical protein